MSSQDERRKSHKRKSNAMDLDESNEAGPSNLKVTLSQPSSTLGPVFANFPSIRPSKDIPFYLDTRYRDAKSTEDISRQKTRLSGETEDIEFFSTNRDKEEAGEDADCQYLPALYDPDSGTLHINTSTPMYILTHRAKRMRDLTIQTQQQNDYRARRNDLGEVFGTRKAKSQIRAEERNKLDAGAMEVVRGHLMETIGVKEESAEQNLPSDLIPPPNMSTEDPALVYPRDALMSDSEWSSIDVISLLKQKDDRSRAGLLPYRRSRFVESKMREIANAANLSSSVKKSNMRMCYFLSCLLALYDQGGRLSKTPTNQISSKFPGVPLPVLDSILEKFTKLSGDKRTVTEKLQTKLIAWIGVVYLHLSDFRADLSTVSGELKMQPAKVINIFRSLGCRVDVPPPEEREKMGMSLDEAKNHRKAVLKAPVKFPREKTRMAAKKR